jgi:glycosyltransferase involved in cell wall biosynthesis
MMHDQLRLGIQQRVLPDYRAAFFEALGQSVEGRLAVFGGKPLDREGIKSLSELSHAQLFWGRNYTLFDPTHPFFLCWQYGLLDWLNCWQPHALIVEANPRLLANRRAIQHVHNKGGIVIGWGLGAPPIEGNFASLRQRERITYLKSLDGIIAYSNKGASQYRALGIPEERVFVATNAVLPKPTTPAHHRPIPVISQLQVLFVGRLQRRKRVDLLLKACASLPKELQPLLFIIGDGPARPELERLAMEILPATMFVGDQRGESLATYFKQADLFVLPGTGGLAVQQAMSYALPVIVAQGDGTQEDLVRPQNGWLVPADDVNALQNALREALSDIRGLRKKGLESYRIVAEEVNVEKMAETFISAIDRIWTLAKSKSGY